MLDTRGLLSQFYLQINGEDAPDEIVRSLIEITVETTLHLPSVATVRLHDPDLVWIDDERFSLGKPLVVTARNDEEMQTVFDGEIVELSPHFDPHSQELVVRAFDRLHRLARGRQIRSFVNVTDSDIVEKIASEVGLRAKTDPTSVVHDYVLQHNQTNLEFLRNRAARLGYLLFVRGDTLHMEAPQNGDSGIPLEWGVTLSEFFPTLSTIDQVDEVIVRGWDPSRKEAVIGQAGQGVGSPATGQAQRGSENSPGAFNLSARHLVTNLTVRTQAEADIIARATANRNAGGLIEAEGTCAGTPSLVAGSSITIEAAGERFNGTYFVTEAVHTYNLEEGYTTRFSVSGLNPRHLLGLLSSGSASPAGFAAPRHHGLAVGIVTDNNDPEGQGRVKVMYPWLSDTDSSFWARVAAPGAGSERGIEYLPEINDEVLIGFEFGDIDYPYVIGGLWNGKDDPPKPSSDIVKGGKVQQRIIRSRTGHTIILDDTDGAGKITIKDSSDNLIEIDSAANSLTIDIKGAGDLKIQGNLTIDVTGKLQISGRAGIQIESPANVDVKGAVIRLN